MFRNGIFQFSTVAKTTSYFLIQLEAQKAEVRKMYWKLSKISEQTVTSKILIIKSIRAKYLHKRPVITNNAKQLLPPSFID